MVWCTHVESRSTFDTIEGMFEFVYVSTVTTSKENKRLSENLSVW